MAGLSKESQYWSLLQSKQQQQYPEFINHLSGSLVAEDGKAAVIEFRDNARPSVQKLASSRALRSCLNKDHTADSVRRRIFVLEGLPTNFVMALGAGLGIPPNFFASHWVSPGKYMGTLLNRVPRHYDSHHRFTLAFPRLHRARIKARKGGEEYPVYYMEMSVRRSLYRMTVFGDPGGSLYSFEQLSFWSKRNGESWDAVLLVDPPLGKFVRWKDSLIAREVDHNNSIKLVDSLEEDLEQQGSWYPNYNPSTKLSSEPALWKDGEQSASMKSMFDDIVMLYALMEPQLAADPNRCTDICRRMVLSAWTARLRITEAQIIQEQVRLSIGSTTVVDPTNVFKNSWAHSWRPRDFGRLVRAKSALESFDWELYHNMDALGMHTEAQTTEAWEADAWRNLQTALQKQKATLDNISQAYMQAISVRENIKVGYLTSLATVFIPISFVAAIFSMGGEFGVGETRFWVYWVIAVPVVAAGCLLLFTNPGKRF